MLQATEANNDAESEASSLDVDEVEVCDFIAQPADMENIVVAD